MPAKKKQAAQKPAAKSAGNPQKSLHDFAEKMRFHLRALSDVLPKLKTAERLSAAVKEGWLTATGPKDTKVDEQTIALMKKEVAFIRESARAAIGNRPFRTHAPMTFTITTTVTTGVTNTVLTGGSVSMAPTNITEQSSFNALFDEVKVHGGLVDWIYNNACPASGAVTTDSLPVIGYDAGDATVAASASAVKQLAAWKSIDCPLSGSLAANSNHHTFKFEVPKGDYIGANAAFVGDIWQDFSNAQAIGAIKFYHVGSVVTAIITGAGHVVLDISFRVRQ